MVIHNYSVTLTKENVDKAKDFIKSSGGKLSPVMDLLLEEWVKKQEGLIDDSEEDKNESLD